MVAVVVGIVLVLLVPTLVWSAIVAGLYHIVRDKVRQRVKTVVLKVAVAQGTK